MRSTNACRQYNRAVDAARLPGVRPILCPGCYQVAYLEPLDRPGAHRLIDRYGRQHAPVCAALELRPRVGGYRRAAAAP